MIAAAVLLAVIVTEFVAHPLRRALCFPFLSSTEKSVVGEWQAQMLGGISIMKVHADHTWSSAGGSCFGDGGPYLRGGWRVDGSDVIFTYAPGQFGGADVPPWRCSIQWLIDQDRHTRLALSDPQE